MASTNLATFGAGCFWGVELNFRRVPGVVNALVGYEGGTTSNPTYRDVCSGTTNHAEVVQVEYDPEKVTFDHLLDVFFELHDPTTPNRQGPDVGTQYRSVVFYHDEAQKQAAESKIEALTAQSRFRRPIVTQVVPAATFYMAEDYHQRYLEKRGQTHCSI
jgi:peptide-methionine (S)-S-oxide reductase